MIVRPTASVKSHSPAKVRSTDDGLHLSGSILWLDSHLNGDLSFLSSANDPAKTRVPKVIATEETIKILETYRKKPNALVCQYNRPFSIGRLKMELLPSGSVLGGASLFVENDKEKILYAPNLQTEKINLVRQMQLKKASTLILGAYHPDPGQAMPARKKEKERFLEVVQKYLENKVYPIIICRPIATAQEITKLLCDAGVPVSVQSTIYNINRVYEAYGSKLGDYSLYSPRHAKPRVLIHPTKTEARGKIRNGLPDGPILFIEDTAAVTSDTGLTREPTQRFHISSLCDGPELKEVITAVNPKDLFIFGPYAKRYVEVFKDLATNVKPLFANDQPTLF